MRGIQKGLLGLLAVLTLASCGGAPEATPEETLGETTQGLACRHPDDWCPGRTQCIDGMCWDCELQPERCP